VKRGARVNGVFGGKTVIQHACGSSQENVELVEFLIASGADINAHIEKYVTRYDSSTDESDFGDENKSYALELAVQKGYARTVQLLLRNGAIGPCSIPLVCEVEGDRDEILRTLYEYGIGDGISTEMKVDALYNAIKCLQVKIMKLLLEHDGLVSGIYFLYCWCADLFMQVDTKPSRRELQQALYSIHHSKTSCLYLFVFLIGI
jgi:hypothetical protein